MTNIFPFEIGDEKSTPLPPLLTLGGLARAIKQKGQIKVKRIEIRK